APFSRPAARGRQSRVVPPAGAGGGAPLTSPSRGGGRQSSPVHRGGRSSLMHEQRTGSTGREVVHERAPSPYMHGPDRRLGPRHSAATPSQQPTHDASPRRQA